MVSNPGKFQFLKNIHREAIPGLILLAVAILAMVLANGSLSEVYFSIVNFKIGSLTLQLWVNDALMVIFFFMVGMEIKRELIQGELNSVKKATLPLAAALGGMIFPALIYVYFNPQAPNLSGWGIPMATDIAFALGTLSLLGQRVPKSLVIFLMALAVIDDLGAILVIAFFYTSQIKILALGLASLGLMAILVMQFLKIKNYGFYIIIGIAIWSAFLISGVHATIAGVLIGLLTPIRFSDSKRTDGHYSPINELVHWLHPWSSYAIMPMFAFFNAGVALGDIHFGELISHPINQGVLLGLFAGKTIGISLFCLLAVKLGLAALPKGAQWSHVTGVAMIAGIGFTMSLFISSLALSPELEIYSKTGILMGSILAAIVGFTFLRFYPHKISGSNH